jgi:large subunit ribosomal protein L10
MSKMLNKVIAADLETKFTGAEGFVAVNYQGLNSAEEYEFRKILREAGQTVHVVPNRLARRVVAPAIGLEIGADPENGNQEGYDSLFRGPTALVVGHERTQDEVIAGAKAVVEWARKNKQKVSVKGGAFSGKVLDEAEMRKVAKIPDIHTLHSQIAGLFQAPIRNVASATQQIIARVVYALSAYKDKLEEGGGGGES